MGHFISENYNKEDVPKSIMTLYLEFFIQIYLYTISVYLNTVLFKRLESVRSFKCF